MSSRAGAGPSEPTRRTPSDVPQLETEPRYRRDRLALSRARVVSARPTSPGRLRELERISAAADARLRHAQGR
jgi:hypothetical protein